MAYPTKHLDLYPDHTRGQPSSDEYEYKPIQRPLFKPRYEDNLTGVPQAFPPYRSGNAFQPNGPVHHGQMGNESNLLEVGMNDLSFEANYTFSKPGEERNYEELAPGSSYDPKYSDSRSQRHHEDSRLRRLSRDLTLHHNQTADEVAADYERAPDHAMRVRRESRGKTETGADFKREPRMREMQLADACPIHVDEDDQDEEFDNEDKAGIGLTPRRDSRNQRVIYGKRPSQRLDPRFIFQPKPNKFFIPGRVIKAPWPETEGRGGIIGDNNRSRQYSDLGVYEKIRWFVIVRAGHYSCTGLPISTYSHGALTKKKVRKREHCIIYTDKCPPEQPGESSRDGRDQMSNPIKVIAASPGDQMEPLSRLNYGKMYTIEHNIRVYHFGMVVEWQIQELLDRWALVLHDSISRRGHSGGSSLNMETATANESSSQTDYVTPDSPRQSQTPFLAHQPSPAYVDSGEAVGKHQPNEESQQQLVLRKHDRLSVVQWTNNMQWAMAHNHRSKATGLVHYTWLKLDEKMIAIYDWSQLPAETGYVKIRKGDQLGLIDSTIKGWSTIWKLSTSETGLVPSDYIRKHK